MSKQNIRQKEKQQKTCEWEEAEKTKLYSMMVIIVMEHVLGVCLTNVHVCVLLLAGVSICVNLVTGRCTER